MEIKCAAIHRQFGSDDGVVVSMFKTLPQPVSGNVGRCSADAAAFAVVGFKVLDTIHGNSSRGDHPCHNV